jgi:ATP-dependent DNA helicase RecQ
MNKQRLVLPLLRTVFGIARLRPGQQEVIDKVLAGQDTLAIMPTGGGKSLCYQLPAKILRGLTVVVSPLISLMKDQLDKLHGYGMRAAQVNSSIAREEEEQALRAIEQGELEILFCTPERLVSPEFIALLARQRVALVVVDEAHCISRWGHDFRPAYLELGAALEALGRPPVLAMTATATDEVVADIGTQLGRPNLALINTGVYRANLRYRVIQETNEHDKLAQMLALVRQCAGAGIVYTATVKAALQGYAMLRADGASVALYHGKLGAAQRKQAQDSFMQGRSRVMVATNAFGMGIDKRDIRFVIHAQLPASVDAYYQESGRAGRDGQRADCLLLYLQEDKRTQQYLLISHYPDAQQLKAVLGMAQELLARGPASVAALQEHVGMRANALRVCLKLLKQGRLLRQNRKLEYLPTGRQASAGQFATLAQLYRDKHERDRMALDQMVAYAQSGHCRWKIILDYFSDAPPGFERCGACDNCLHPLTVQAAPPERIGAATASGSGGPTPTAPCRFEPGARVRVPKFDVGTVVRTDGDKVTIAFARFGTRVFLCDHVAPA